MTATLKNFVRTVGLPLVVLAGLFGFQAAPTVIAGDELQECEEFEASDIAWVTLDENFDIDEQVDSYPSGTELITPVFEYECIPSRVTVTTIYSLEGEVVFTDDETLRAKDSSGLYAYPLGTTDDTALPDGLWSVEYYADDELLTTGEVVVGDAASDSIEVEGTVKDKKTRRNIRGATILVLQPGVTAQGWIDEGQDADDVLTAGQSNSQGTFVLQAPLVRNETYSLIVVARGYKPIANDRFVIGDNVEAPAQLNILLSK